MISLSNASERLPDQTVFVVDDDEALRDSLVWLLESNHYAVRTFASAESFLEVFDPNLAGCLVLDVRMPGRSGLALFDDLKALGSTLPVIFISGHGDVPMAVSALKKGAIDFIEKPFHQEDMLSLIEGCLVRERADRERRRLGADSARRLALLTHREREVLDLIIGGKLNKQVADALGISIKTVEVHRSRVMEKMGARTFAELMQSVLAAEAQGAPAEFVAS